MRPSAVGPTELKLAIVLSSEIAPIVSIFSESPGTVIFSQVLLPSLPALPTINMPLSNAISAAREMSALLPVSSLWV